MGRLTDNDKKFLWITYGKSDWKALRFVFSSDGRDEYNERTKNNITVYAFDYVFRILLPRMIKPYAIKHIANWDQKTIERLGRDHYYEYFPKEYGFCLSGGFLQLFYGAQTFSSETTKSKGYFLPWLNWRHTRTSYYDTNGELSYHEKYNGKNVEPLWDAGYERKSSIPRKSYEIEDYDGQHVIADCYVREYEYKYGTGWFSWLSIFRKSKIRRTLDITFQSEIGREKGSWKGGMIGTGIEMLDSKETHTEAFMRFCSQSHNSKSGVYDIKFIKEIK